MAIQQGVFYRGSITRVEAQTLFDQSTSPATALTNSNSSAKCTVIDQAGAGNTLVNAQACSYDSVLTHAWYYDLPATVCVKDTVLYVEIVVFDSGGTTQYRVFDAILFDNG